MLPLKQNPLTMKIKDILTLDRVVFNAQVKSKKKAFELIAETIAYTSPQLNAHTIFDNLIERERLGSTAIGHSVALPHCRMDALQEAKGCFILLKNGVDFAATDGIEVRMLFSLLVPQEALEVHLHLLGEIARTFHDEKFRESLLHATSKEDLYQHLING